MTATRDDEDNLPSERARQSSVRWVSGRILATSCAQWGRLSSGKNVPEKRNIGVMKRNSGRLKVSMVGTMAVKTMAAQAKARPPRNAAGNNSRACGYPPES